MRWEIRKVSVCLFRAAVAGGWGDKVSSFALIFMARVAFLHSLEVVDEGGKGRSALKKGERVVADETGEGPTPPTSSHTTTLCLSVCMQC